jgi:hypothetical protein
MVVRIPGKPDAYSAYLAVSVSIGLALEVGYGRATKPESFPIIPREGLIDWLTRRTLSDLMDLGFEPEGWQQAYMSQELSWGEPWARNGDGA